MVGFFLFDCSIALLYHYFSSSSSRIISAKDHGAIQIDFVDVDPENGRMIPGKVTRYAICGALRAMVRSICTR